MPVEVKICGLTNVDDAQAALECGADFLGFVIYRKSPRGISARELRAILDKLSAPRKAVGVFVNMKSVAVARIAADCGLHAVQIHGDEDAADFRNMPVSLWRAVWINERAFSPSPDAWPAGRFVVDAATPGMYGGTGVSVDWNAARRLADRFPVMLAGGLTPKNVADAIRTMHPLGVDVAGGVEVSPGRKDRAKMEAFIREARKA